MTRANSGHVPPAADEPVGLDEILAPHSRATFIAEFWNRRFLHVPGMAGRFASLFSWDELNLLLEQRHLKPPRVQLARAGKYLPAEQFMAPHGGLNSAGVTACLADGATLIVNSVDEMRPAVGRLAGDIQDALLSSASVNLYASWFRQPGFDLHWDPQDTLILQLAGRKHWTVHAPTMVHPFEADKGRIPMPADAPVWDGMLEDGDALYLPRGWWHAVVPLDEPTLHLTVTTTPATGADLLRWYVARLAQHEEVRRDVPHMASLADRASYVETMRDLMARSMSEGLVDAFIADWGARLPARPRFHLPEAPLANREAITLETRVRLGTTRRMTLTIPEGDGPATLEAGGLVGDCPVELVPALRMLSGVASQPVSALCAHLPPGVDASKLLLVLTVLLMRGVIQLEPGDAP